MKIHCSNGLIFDIINMEVQFFLTGLFDKQYKDKRNPEDNPQIALKNGHDFCKYLAEVFIFFQLF